MFACVDESGFTFQKLNWGIKIGRKCINVVTGRSRGCLPFRRESDAFEDSVRTTIPSGLLPSHSVVYS